MLIRDLLVAVGDETLNVGLGGPRIALDHIEQTAPPHRQDCHDPSSQVSISSSKVIGSPQHGEIPPVPTRVMKLWQSEQYCSPS
jgi:hypothetical protein